MADQKKIVEVLEALDHADPREWTEDGFPRLDLVQDRADDETITEADVKEAAPGYRRAPPSKMELRQTPDAEGDDEVEGAEKAQEPEKLDRTQVQPETIETFHSDLADIKELLAEAEAYRDTVMNRIRELNSAHDYVVSQIAKLDTNRTRMSTVRKFLARQHEEAEKRNRTQRQLGQALGVNLGQDQSPIDAIMRNRPRPRRDLAGPSILGNVLDLGSINMKVGTSEQVVERR